MASAHPLGNFTVNRFSDVEVSGNRVYVLYVLDMAEIPTFQARQSGVDPAVYARRIAGNAHLTVDGRPATLTPVRHVIAFPKGQGGLHTMRLEVVLRGPKLARLVADRLSRRNYGDRIGWKEVVVRERAAPRDVVVRSGATESDALRAYPKDLLHSPLDVTSATATVAPGAGEGPAPATTGGTALQAPDRVADSGFSSLVARGKLSAGVVLLSLLLAAFWGAAHALTPGHGKALVAGYLVGTKGTPRHAVLLGATVTITHTAGVFGLGLVTLALSHFIVPETLYPWLTLVSGLLVVGVGAAVLRSRLRSGSLGPRPSHGPGGDHHHDHARSRPPRPRPRSPPRPRRRGADEPGHPRRRDRSRDPAVPLRARRPPQRDRPAPDRLRAGADHRLQPRPCLHRHGHRARRRARPACLRPGLAGGANREDPARRERARHPLRRRRDHRACTTGRDVRRSADAASNRPPGRDE